MPHRRASCSSLAAAYLATGYLPLLVLILLIALSMLEQFTPFMRFDGYYLFADLIGAHAACRGCRPWSWRCSRPTCW